MILQVESSVGGVSTSKSLWSTPLPEISNEALAARLKIHFLAFISSGMFGGLLGESMYRYSYDLQTGTSHYRRSDGTIDSWTSPQSRGNCIRENFIRIECIHSSGSGESHLFAHYRIIRVAVCLSLFESHSSYVFIAFRNLICVNTKAFSLVDGLTRWQ